MPNWCTNYVARIDGLPFGPKFQRFFNNGQFDFELVIKIPKGIKSLIPLEDRLFRNDPPLSEQEEAKLGKQIESRKSRNITLYGSATWYDWCVKNWGTKWNITDSYQNIEDEHWSFDTAWSPPIPVIKALAKKTRIPLKISYLEEGMSFCGIYSAYPDESKNVDEYYDSVLDAPSHVRDEVGYVEPEDDED